MCEPTTQTNKAEHFIRVLLEETFDSVITNITYKILPNKTVRNNYVGSLYNVTVSGNKKLEGYIEYYLIIKMAPDSSHYRKLIPVREMFIREAYVYNNVIPNFIRLQKEANLLEINRLSPKMYVTSINDCKEVVAMEDMTATGFKGVNHHIPLDYPHALIVLRAFGQLHALSYVMKSKKPDIYKQWEIQCGPGILSTFRSEAYITCIKSLGQLVLDSYSDENSKEKSALQRFVDNYPNTNSSFNENCKYTVLTHGDADIRNILFKYEDPELPDIPTDACIIDWQLARTGSPALDVLLFMMVCTEKELRERYYDHLIQEYYNSLSDTLIKMGSDPRTTFPFEILQMHLNKFASTVFYGSLMRIALYLKKAPVNTESNNTNSNIFKDKLAQVPDGYVQRIRDLLADLVKYNYEM